MTYPKFVETYVKWFDTPQLNLVHSAMGLLGECIEFSEAVIPSHKREELGDLEFYYEQALQTVSAYAVVVPMPITREEFCILERDPEYWITHWCAEYHDHAKKAWVYNKPLAELGFVEQLARIALCLQFLATKLKTTRPEVQALNMEKLEKRYGASYSDLAAQKRVDKLNSGSAFV